MRETRLRRLVDRYAFDLDGFGHRLEKLIPLPHWLGHNLCLAADVTVGWGPDAADWKEQRTRFLRWFYRWFWNGRCPTCRGEGEVEIWRKGDPSDVFHTEVCEGCQGSRRMTQELAASV
jgi:hypothetical protein